MSVCWILWSFGSILLVGAIREKLFLYSLLSKMKVFMTVWKRFVWRIEDLKLLIFKWFYCLIESIKFLYYILPLEFYTGAITCTERKDFSITFRILGTYTCYWSKTSIRNERNFETLFLFVITIIVFEDYSNCW